MPTQSGKRELSDLPPREMRHAIAWSSFRTIVAVVGIIGAYAVMPLGVDDIKAQGVLFAIVGLGLFVWVFIRQLRKIQDADFPVLRAAQALVLVVSLFLTIFAAASVALETSTPGSFNEGLT
ncbi:MAG TPA: hypothetical protein VMT88_09680, partial [Actinomycetes bacterium]|nr:hypothetical protein [Actinomycetes bacterium]